MQLNIKAFAIGLGILYGLGLFLVTWWVIAFEGITHDPTFIGRVFLGYQLSPLGSVLGLIWGFVVGAIAGGIFAWLYNRLAREQPAQASAAPASQEPPLAG